MIIATVGPANVKHAGCNMLLDDFLSIYDVSDAVATVVDADLATTWDALMDVDLIEVGRKKPLVGVLGALRILPDVVNHLFHGELPQPPPQHLRLRDTTRTPLEGGRWVLLGERAQEEIALGLVGKFWRPVIEFAPVSADDFRDFRQPGFAKTVYSLSVRRIDEGHTLLSGVMRTATTDEHARRWFRRYWTLAIGSGAHLLVNGLLEVTRDVAEEWMRCVSPEPVAVRALGVTRSRGPADAVPIDRRAPVGRRDRAVQLASTGGRRAARRSDCDPRPRPPGGAAHRARAGGSTLRSRRDAGTSRSTIGAVLECVRAVAPDAHWCGEELVACGPATTRPRVLAAIRSRGGDLRAVTTSEGRLDELYSELVERHS